jgi:glycosyltransferase involved in cell wall biosynthesis
MEDWDAIWRRNQFLCATLSRRFPDTKILFVGLPVNVSNRVRCGRWWSDKDGPLSGTVEGYPNITVTRALKLFPDSITLGRKINEAMARFHIRSVATRLGMRSPLLWLNPHSAVHMAGRMSEGAVVYDITDDWALVPSFSERERTLIASQDQSLCKRADMVIACSDAIHASRLPCSKRVLLLPNGVDVEHYSGVMRRVNGTSNGAKGAKGALPHPVFGYTGTLHRDRIDAALLVRLARAFPSGSIVLIGPDHLDGETRARLAAERNIHLCGPAPYTEIPARMAAFDVCIVPHVVTPFTESLNPIKLWEYLASGKPVVSTAVAGFRDYGDLCHIAPDAEGFITRCREALGENGARSTERIAVARKNSWESRVDTLLAALEPLGVAA